MDTYPIAGKDITNYLLNLLLTQFGSGKSIYLDHIITKEIKEKLSLCILEPEEEIRKIKDGFTKYRSNIDLPNGSSLEINSERFLISEPLFNPSIILDYRKQLLKWFVHGIERIGRNYCRILFLQGVEV